MILRPTLTILLMLALVACARGATPPDPNAGGDTGGNQIVDPDAGGDTGRTPDTASPRDMGGEPDLGAPDLPEDEPVCENSFYPDSDGDGHGAMGSNPVVACEAPTGYAEVADDCDDANAAVYNGAPETPADGTDQNCDGMEECYVDGDDDGVRSADGETVLATDLTCEGAGLATADAPAGDCDDDNPEVQTPGVEVCNGMDDDCNGFADDGDTCPCPAVQQLGQLYLFCDDGATWTEAEIFCQRAGQHLVKVDDAAENDFLTSQARARGIDETWLGLNDRQNGGQFVWHDGSAAGYTAWNPGQPNNGDGGDQDCAELHTCVDPGSCQDDSWIGR